MKPFKSKNMHYCIFMLLLANLTISILLKFYGKIDQRFHQTKNKLSKLMLRLVYTGDVG
jgi:hypothetical protein